MISDLMQQVIDVHPNGLDPYTIAENLYPDTPVASLRLAATNVVKILLKLERDGAVEGRFPADGYG